MNPLRVLLAAVFCLGATFSSPAVIKIACVGDSITEGTGLSSPATESYPAKLQKLLGSEFEVKNFGVSGRTLLRKGDFPYWKESAFTQSHNYNPDIVTILLGTNDGKPFNWKYGTNFVTDLQDMIASYATLPSHPRILLGVPPPAFGTGGYSISPGIISTNIVPLVREAGTNLDLELIDLYRLLLAQKTFFPDNIHPNTKGTTVFAAIFRTALLGTNSVQEIPVLESARNTLTRSVLRWPAQSAGWVLQSTTALRETNTTWSVVEQLAVNDGSVLRVTNAVTGVGKFYRLWNPTF
jgi:lysophospholipase L1-like esterase